MTNRHQDIIIRKLQKIILKKVVIAADNASIQQQKPLKLPIIARKYITRVPYQYVTQRARLERSASHTIKNREAMQNQVSYSYSRPSWR